MNKWYHIITATLYYQEKYFFKKADWKGRGSDTLFTFTALIELYFVLQLDYID